jgi:hypothetical protein
MNGTTIYDGTMIRAEDVGSQKTRLSKFEFGVEPKTIRK